MDVAEDEVITKTAEVVDKNKNGERAVKITDIGEEKVVAGIVQNVIDRLDARGILCCDDREGLIIRAVVRAFFETLDGKNEEMRAESFVFEDALLNYLMP